MQVDWLLTEQDIYETEAAYIASPQAILCMSIVWEENKGLVVTVP